MTFLFRDVTECVTTLDMLYTRPWPPMAKAKCSLPFVSVSKVLLGNTALPIHIHIYVHIHTQIYVYTYTPISIHTHIYSHYTHIYPYSLYIENFIYIYTHMYSLLRIEVYTQCIVSRLH